MIATNACRRPLDQRQHQAHVDPGRQILRVGVGGKAEFHRELDQYIETVGERIAQRIGTGAGRVIDPLPLARSEGSPDPLALPVSNHGHRIRPTMFRRKTHFFGHA